MFSFRAVQAVAIVVRYVHVIVAAVCHGGCDKYDVNTLS